jgi:hypothetical protein
MELTKVMRGILDRAAKGDPILDDNISGTKVGSMLIERSDLAELVERGLVGPAYEFTWGMSYILTRRGKEEATQRGTTDERDRT